MILKRLVEYADRTQDLPPVMYSKLPVRWRIELRADGTLETFFPLGDDSKSNRRGMEMFVPDRVVSSGVKPKLLAQNGEYVLGIPKTTGANQEKVAERHRQFVELVRHCAEETEEKSVESVLRFLDSWEPGRDRTLLPEGFSPDHTITFRVERTIPVDLENVQRFWADYTLDSDAPAMTCLVTGEAGPVEQRLPIKVKGLTRIGGQSSGTSLVSANEKAFESYGLENSLTSPISRDAGEKFGKALNYLLEGEKSKIYVGSLAYVFWTREESELDPVGFMTVPDPERVRSLFDSAHTGIEQRERGNDFYALALSASGGRAVVRDWLETTVPDAAENLRRWFRAQRMVDARGEEAKPLGLYALAAAAYRDANKEMNPQVPATLVRAALKGGRLPEDLLARAVRRNRAEGDVSRQRAALMKLVLSYTEGETVTQTLEKLDMEYDDRAYHCGRLLAELEALQVAAIRGVKATLVDRYYGSASSAPASVFGTLIRNSEMHLGKLRKERGGAEAAIRRRIEEIMVSIGHDFPRTLTLREQARFALGYYHQRAANRAEKNERSERNKNREES